MHNGINKIKIHKTREPEMGFGMIEPGCWRFISLQDGAESVVGHRYASKAELLADCDRYLKEWGYGNTTPQEEINESDDYAGHIAQARESYVSDEIEIDDNPKLSIVDEGVWVAAWVWVDNADVEGFNTEDDDDDEE